MPVVEGETEAFVSSSFGMHAEKKKERQQVRPKLHRVENEPLFG